MEHGDPIGNGWFAFGGAVGGGGIDANSVDLPPANGGAFSLQTGWGSGGTPGFFGGFGRGNPVQVAGVTHFNFWINPDAGQEYTIEVNLQDDDNGDGNITQPDDDEFQYNVTVGPPGSDAKVISGGGWQLVSIPLADFFDDGSFLFGGNGILDPIPTSSGGNGQLINVVFAIISSGPDATFRTDFWCFSDGPQEFIPPPDPFSITDFVLVDADNDVDIMSISSGDMIDISMLPTMNLNIRAETTMDVESVRLELSGAQTNGRTENAAPYALFGDKSGDYNPHVFAIGN